MSTLPEEPTSSQIDAQFDKLEKDKRVALVTVLRDNPPISSPLYPSSVSIPSPRKKVKASPPLKLQYNSEDDEEIMSLSDPRFMLFHCQNSTLILHFNRNHVLTHIPGGYVQHIYDGQYIHFLNKNLLNFLSVWEEKVSKCVDKIKRHFPYWPRASYVAISDFFEQSGGYSSARSQIATYKNNAKVVLQALDEITFYHVLQLKDAHLATLLYNAAHSRMFKLTFVPNKDKQSFKLRTTHVLGGRAHQWDFE